MLDRDLIAWLESKSVRFCAIGAFAMAAHGWARYSADIDLLTLETRALDADFWPAGRNPEIRTGDVDDPLAGLVRLSGVLPHDLIVGRGPVMRFAVDTASRVGAVGCSVASPVALVLLKLEAGGAQDLYDIAAFVAALRMLDGAPWLADVDTELDRLGAPARLRWETMRRQLAGD